MRVRLATRRSPLALVQTELVASALRARGHACDVVEVDTEGDRDQSRPLREIAGTGVFTAAVDRAVLTGDADAAVHSAKDLPSSTADGLVIAAVVERADPADALVGRSLAGLGPGARVATGSPRRRAMMLHVRPDLDVVELRGNMARRVGAVGTGGVDAVVVAMAALARLGWLDRVAERLDPEWFVPQVGQGAIAVACRGDDEEVRATLASIDDPTASRALAAERAFLRELGAGCSVPAAAYAQVEGIIRITGVMASADGARLLSARLEGDDPEVLGGDLARHLRDDMGGAGLEGWAP